MLAVTCQIVTCTTHGRTAGVKIILRITNLQKVVGGGGDRGKDDHNTGGEASKRERAGQRGRDVWHWKGLEADIHSRDPAVECGDDDGDALAS